MFTVNLRAVCATQNDKWQMINDKTISSFFINEGLLLLVIILLMDFSHASSLFHSVMFRSFCEKARPTLTTGRPSRAYLRA